MANLKPGWKRVKFGEVVRLVKETCKDPVAAGIDRVIGLEHLEPGDLRVRSWNDIADGTTFTTRGRPGQVLFGKRRAYQRKVAVADFDAICSGDIYVFETANPQRLLPELLPFLCQTEAFFEYAVGTSAGSLSPRTNWSSLAEYEFALPPLEEQRRMAGLLTAAQNAYCAIDEARGAGITAIAAFREETVRNLIKKYPRKPIKDLTLLVTKGESPRWQGFEYCAQGVRFITSENVLDGYLSISPAKFLPHEFGAKLARSRLQTDDILINIVGGSIGRLCCVPDGIGEANINQAVALVRPNLRVTVGNYLFSYLSSPSVKHTLCSRKVDDYKPNLSLSSIREFLVPIPPLSVQKTYAREATMLHSSLDSMATRLRAQREIMQTLINETIGQAAP